MSFLGLALFLIYTYIAGVLLRKEFFMVFYGRRSISLPLSPVITYLAMILTLFSSVVIYMSLRRRLLSILGFTLGASLLMISYAPFLALAGLLYSFLIMYYYSDISLVKCCLKFLLLIYLLLVALSIFHYICKLLLKVELFVEIARIEAILFYFPGYELAIMLTLMLLYSWIPFFISRKEEGRSGTLPISKGYKSEYSTRRNNRHLYMLSLFTSYLIMAVIYTVWDSKLIGEDFRYYVRTLNVIANNPFLIASRPRALVFVLALLYYTFLHDSYEAIKLTTITISLIFTLAVLHAMEKLCDHNLDIASALSACFSPTLIASLFAAVFSNWLALIPLYILLAYIHKVLRLEHRGLLIAILSSVLLRFSHPWTWGVLMCTIVILLLIMYSKGRKDSFKALVILLSLNMLIDIAWSYSLGGVSAIEAGEKTYQSVFRMDNVLDFPLHVYLAFRYYLAGTFTNFPFLMVSIIGIINLYRYKKDHGFLIASWLLVLSLMFPFLERGIHWRVLYEIPFPLLGGLGIRHITLSIRDKYLKMIITVAFILSQVSYTFRMIAILPTFSR